MARTKQKGKRPKAKVTNATFSVLLCTFYLYLSCGTAQAAPTVAQMLGFRPKLEGIVYSTPSAQEQEACKVELVTGSKPGSNGWLLRDPRGLPLRRYFDSNADKKVDLWVYYHDGAEAYREIDSNFNEKVDQYRWLNSGGSKWGVDLNEDGKIDAWKAVSAEEVSQELLQAVITRDLARLQTLFITEADIKALELPATEVTRIRQLQAQAPAKFQATLGKTAGLSDKTHWIRLEAGVPQCLPADQTGLKQDLLKYVRSTVLYENNGKHDFLPVGEMILVGSAWRLLEAPGDDAAPAPSPELQKGLDELRKLDAAAPKSLETPGPNPETVRYNLQRADIIQRLIPKDRPEQREIWYRQMAECLGAAAQSCPDTDKTAYTKLVQLAQQLAKEQPGSGLAAFVTFREMQADYAIKLGTATAQDFAKLQGQWLERLAQFVQTYPKAEDAPEALMQLGMVSEFVNKEIEAKNWYGQLVKEFPSHPQVAKARGAIARLDSEGKELQLAGPQRGTNAPFDLSRLRGKVVVVYYWASWNQQCVGDFARLAVLLKTYGAKGLDLVCVNLDSGPPEADNPLTKNPPPGVQLFQPGGLESPLAVQYGIHSLPHLFLVGRDGKVLSRTVQVGNLEDELKKHMK